MKDKILSLIIISIIMLITVSCGTAANTPEETDKKEVSEAGEGAYETLNIIPFNERKFIYRNGLNVEYKEETSDDNNKKISKYYPQISGLINKEVEKKVNDSIISNVDILYSEAEDFIPSTNTNMEINLSVIADICYNCNNVIFIQYYVGASYNSNTDSDSYNNFCSDKAEGFDLNTGNRLDLKDLFKKGTDYESIINDYLFMEIIIYNYDDPDSMFMNRSFQGIRANQSYSFNENYLTIIMDKNNEEFNTSENSIMITIPLKEIGDKLAIFDRYFNEDINIFENKRIKNLMPNYIHYEINDGIIEYKENYRIYIEEGEFLHADNSEVNNMLDSMLSNNMDVAGFKERAAEFNKSHPGKHYGEIYHYPQITIQSGGYLSATVYSTIEENGAVNGRQKFINFDFNNNKIMTLKDIFIAGYDYKNELIKILKDNDQYNYNYYLYNSSIVEEGMVLLEDKFSFGNNYVCIYLHQPGRKYDDFSVAIDFGDIGYENLAIYQ